MLARLRRLLRWAGPDNLNNLLALAFGGLIVGIVIAESRHHVPSQHQPPCVKKMASSLDASRIRATLNLGFRWIPHRMTSITKPKFIALDTSNLNCLSRDWTSSDIALQRKARDFCSFLEANDYIPFLTAHHLLEMVAIEDDRVVSERIQFLQERPMLGWVGLASDGSGLGSVADILAAEVLAALNLQGATAAQIRKCVSKTMIKVGSGRDALAPYAGNWKQLRIVAQEQSRRSREVVAICRTKIGDNYGKTVAQVLSGKIRPPQERAAAFEVMKADLQKEVANRGDRRIESPTDVASRFFEPSLANVNANYESPFDFFFETLFENGIDPNEIPPDMKFEDLLDLIEFRRKMFVSARIAGIHLGDWIRDIKESQCPSLIVYKSIRKFGHDLEERKGSELTDNYLASFSPYVDLVLVDRRTKENFRRALQKVPTLSGLINRVEKASRYDAARSIISNDVASSVTLF